MVAVADSQVHRARVNIFAYSGNSHVSAKDQLQYGLMNLTMTDNASNIVSLEADSLENRFVLKFGSRYVHYVHLSSYGSLKLLFKSPFNLYREYRAYGKAACVLITCKGKE